MKAYKGFDKDLKCRGVQYEVGKEYEEDKAELCECGFHACENPIDVFAYYAPATSRYCEVELEDVTDEHRDDSKRCGKRIKIGSEIGISGIVKAFVKFTLDKIDWKDSVATNTGNRSVATNTGNRSVATNTGDWSVATNTGSQSAATNTGSQSAATVERPESIAIALGIRGMAKGVIGSYIVVAEWECLEDDGWHIACVRSHKVDGKTIKPDVFYTLRHGKFVIAD